MVFPSSFLYQSKPVTTTNYADLVNQLDTLQGFHAQPVTINQGDFSLYDSALNGNTDKTAAVVVDSGSTKSGSTKKNKS
jgi:hypothetical protein